MRTDAIIQLGLNLIEFLKSIFLALPQAEDNPIRANFPFIISNYGRPGCRSRPTADPVRRKMVASKAEGLHFDPFQFLIGLCR